MSFWDWSSGLRTDRSAFQALKKRVTMLSILAEVHSLCGIDTWLDQGERQREGVGSCLSLLPGRTAEGGPIARAPCSQVQWPTQDNSFPQVLYLIFFSKEIPAHTWSLLSSCRSLSPLSLSAQLEGGELRKMPFGRAESRRLWEVWTLRLGVWWREMKWEPVEASSSPAQISGRTRTRRSMCFRPTSRKQGSHTCPRCAQQVVHR